MSHNNYFSNLLRKSEKYQNYVINDYINEHKFSFIKLVRNTRKFEKEKIYNILC